MSGLRVPPYDSTFQILDPADRNLWSNLNFLVVGPPGSGKLSFSIALSRALAPRARILLCDWETEGPVQADTLDRLQRHLQARSRPEIGKPREEVLIFRHIHRLAEFRLRALLSLFEAEPPFGASEEPEGRLHLRATCHETPGRHGGMTSMIRGLFPCEVRLPGMPQAREDLTLFLMDLLRELNHSHGRRVTEIESAVLDEVCRLAPSSSLYELRALVEKSYIETPGKRLSILTNH